MIVETKNYRVEFKLDKECKRVIKPLAREFDIPMEKFLTLFATRTLPGQPKDTDQRDVKKAPVGFSVSRCKDEALWARVERAAEYYEEPLQVYLWNSIMNNVRSLEEVLIFSPRNGRPIGSDSDIYPFQTREALRGPAAEKKLAA